MSSLELYVRLAFAVAVLLAPGWCLAWALGVRSVSAALGWSLTLLFVAFTLTFLLASSLTTAIALYAIAGLAALLAMVVRRPVSTVLERGVPGRWAAAAAGLLLGIILWHVAERSRETGSSTWPGSRSCSPSTTSRSTACSSSRTAASTRA